jgi:hypothetical protein
MASDPAVVVRLNVVSISESTRRRAVRHRAFDRGQSPNLDHVPHQPNRFGLRVLFWVEEKAAAHGKPGKANFDHRIFRRVDSTRRCLPGSLPLLWFSPWSGATNTSSALLGTWQKTASVVDPTSTSNQYLRFVDTPAGKFVRIYAGTDASSSLYEIDRWDITLEA